MRGVLWFGGISGFWRGGFGEEVYLGDGVGSDGDLRWIGEVVVDFKIGGDLMEVVVVGFVSMFVSCDGVWGDLRFFEGEFSIGDWIWRIVGDFRGLMFGECIWLFVIDIFKGFRFRLRWFGGVVLRLVGLLEGLRGSGGIWLSRLLVFWSGLIDFLRFRKLLLLFGFWDMGRNGLGFMLYFCWGCLLNGRGIIFCWVGSMFALFGRNFIIFLGFVLVFFIFWGIIWELDFMLTFRLIFFFILLGIILNLSFRLGFICGGIFFGKLFLEGFRGFLIGIRGKMGLFLGFMCRWEFGIILFIFMLGLMFFIFIFGGRFSCFFVSCCWNIFLDNFWGFGKRFFRLGLLKIFWLGGKFRLFGIFGILFG